MQISEVIKECADWWAEPEFEKTLARDPKFAAMIFMAWQAGRWSAEDEYSASVQLVPDSLELDASGRVTGRMLLPEWPGKAV